MTEMASLVLYAADATMTAAFYRAIGLDLADEDHGEGPVHFAAELGPLHFAIYPPRRRAGLLAAGLAPAASPVSTWRL